MLIRGDKSLAQAGKESATHERMPKLMKGRKNCWQVEEVSLSAVR